MIQFIIFECICLFSFNEQDHFALSVLKVILDIIQEQNHFDNLLSCGMQEPSYEEMEIVVQNYVQSLIQEHPYWN